MKEGRGERKEERVEEEGKEGRDEEDGEAKGKEKEAEGRRSGREEGELLTAEGGRGNKSEIGDKADEAESRGPLPGTRNWSTPELANGEGDDLMGQPRELHKHYLNPELT